MYRVLCCSGHWPRQTSRGARKNISETDIYSGARAGFLGPAPLFALAAGTSMHNATKPVGPYTCSHLIAHRRAKPSGGPIAQCFVGLIVGEFRIAPKYPLYSKAVGGGGGIRTPGRRKPSTVFKTAAFDHSATPPSPARLAPSRPRRQGASTAGTSTRAHGFAGPSST